MIAADMDSLRRRISLKVEELQGLIEASKFESGDLDIDQIQKRIGEGQLVFVLLLSLARQAPDLNRIPDTVRAAVINLDKSVATALEALANHILAGSQPAVPALDDRLNAFEQAIAGPSAQSIEFTSVFNARLGLYRPLIAAIEQLSFETLNSERDIHAVLALAIQ